MNLLLISKEQKILTKIIQHKNIQGKVQKEIQIKVQNNIKREAPGQKYNFLHHKDVESEQFFKDVCINYIIISIDEASHFSSHSLKEKLKRLSKLKIPFLAIVENESKEIIELCYKYNATSVYDKKVFMNSFEEILDKELAKIQCRLLEKFDKNFVSSDEKMREKISKLSSAQDFDRLLLTGPTGVGKSTLARFIHHFFTPNAPFVEINLSQLSETLIESELFGHEKGAFTGALTQKVGLFEQAHGGTLFLDEIGTISLKTQKKLLKVIDEKKFSKVGSNKVIHSRFKLMTATCDDLEDLVRHKSFRADLFFRLKGIEIKIPSLSKRKSDIPLLIENELKSINRKIIFTNECLHFLKNRDWKGNIRELKHFVQEMSLFSKGIINIEDLPKRFFNKREAEHFLTSHFVFLRPSMFEFIEKNGLNEFLKRLKKEIINHAIDKYGDKINLISRELRISKTLYYNIKNFQIL